MEKIMERSINYERLLKDTKNLKELVDKGNPHPKFNFEKWLNQWLEKPNHVLNNQKPIEILHTQTGYETVLRILRAMESSTYQ